MRARPHISSTGPAMPPSAIAPASQGRSFFGTGAPRCFPSKRISARPTPDPRYKTPASIQGLTEPMSNLANGVPAPKSNAAAKAAGIPPMALAFIAPFSSNAGPHELPDFAGDHGDAADHHDRDDEAT